MTNEQKDYPIKLFIGKYDFILLFIVFVTAGFLIQRPSIHGHDGILNFVYLESMVNDGDLDFSNNYKYYDAKTKYAYALHSKPLHPETNLPMNFYGIGSSILWSPFYLLVKTFESSGLTDSQKDALKARAVSIGSLFWSTLGLVLLFHTFSQFYSKVFVLAGLLFLLGCTPLSFYIYLHPSMSHACSFFAAAMLVSVYLNPQIKLEKIRWFLMGLSGSLLVMTRYQTALILLAIVLNEIVLFFRNSDKSIGDLVSKKFLNYFICIITFLIAFIPQFYSWYILHGSPFSGPTLYLDTGALNLLKPIYFLNIYFSSRNGLLFWHPLLLLGILGLFFQSRVENSSNNSWLAGIILHSWIIACWAFWWGGASFGHRMFIAVLPLFFIGFLNFAERFKAIKYFSKILFAVLISGSIWNGGLIIQYGAKMVPREDYVSVNQLVYNQFVEVPKFVWTRSADLLIKKEINDK